MSGGATAAGSQLLSNGQLRNSGQQTGFLGGPGAIDGTAQSFYNLADPLNLSGKASSGHALSNILDPGNVLGFNQAANPNGPNGAGNGGIPSVLPNLGANTLIPHTPQGRFMPVQTGGGTFNNMANQGAGRLFNPSAAPMNQSGSKGPAASTSTPNLPMPTHPMLGNGLMPAGGGSTGSPFLNLTWAPDTWTGAPMAINGNLYGWKNNGQVSSMGIIPEGGGLTNSTVFQSMTPGGRAQR